MAGGLEGFFVELGSGEDLVAVDEDAGDTEGTLPVGRGGGHLGLIKDRQVGKVPRLHVAAFLSFRGGCEFWDHLRITAEYRLFFGGSPSVISIGVGWSFFGGHRK